MSGAREWLARVSLWTYVLYVDHIVLIKVRATNKSVVT